MGFSVAIFGLYIIMRVTRLFSKRFRETLQDKNMTVVIRTEDASRARYYKFENGKISSKGQNIPNADMAMIWKDAQTAFNIMKQGKPESFLEAGMSGNLRFDGDPEKSMQFMAVMTEMMEILKPPKD